MMRRVTVLACVAAAMLLACRDAQAGRRNRCGGCSDPCVTIDCGAVAYAAPACGTAACPGRELIDPGPITGMKVVMVPKYVTELRSICSTEYKDEERTRTYTVYKSVPVEEERVRTSIEWVTKTETKTVEYTVQVPVKSEKTAEFTTAVPVYEDVEEKYTVKVPTIREVDEKYTAKVPVVTDAEFTYTVCVPSVETEKRMRTVTNAVPVTLTKTVTHCVPTTTSQTITKDCGHWVSQMTQVASCGGCNGCATVCQRVWVPNVQTVTEVVPGTRSESHQVKYTVYEQRSEQIPFECSFLVYRPETRTGTKKVVEYKEETRTRKRPVVEYVDEEKTRTSKKLSFKEETHSETYPVVSYETQKRTKEVTYTVRVPESKSETYTVTRYDRVPEIKTEKYTTRVAVPVVKTVEVKVCRMVPTLVETTEYPCGSISTGVSCGPKPAPVQCCQ